MKKYVIICVCLIAFFMVFLLLSCKSRNQEEEPWQWSLEKVKSTVGKVRAGRDLTPPSWPDEAKVAVGLSFDFDAETNALRDKIISPGIFSQGEYSARVSVPRILALLDKKEDQL